MNNNTELNNVVVIPSPELDIPVNMPEDIEKQRKNFVFSAEHRRRLSIQTVTVEQTGTAAMRRALRAGIKRRFKLPNTASALFNIDTLYTGYAHEQLLKSGIITASAVKLRDANGTAATVADGTMDIIMATFDGIGRKKHPVRKIVKRIIRDGLWIIENQFVTGGCAVVFKNKRGLFQSLNNAVGYLNKDGAMQYWLNTGSARHYKYYIDSPSGYRQGKNWSSGRQTCQPGFSIRNFFSAMPGWIPMFR